MPSLFFLRTHVDDIDLKAVKEKFLSKNIKRESADCVKTTVDSDG